MNTQERIDELESEIYDKRYKMNTRIMDIENTLEKIHEEHEENKINKRIRNYFIYGIVTGVFATFIIIVISI